MINPNVAKAKWPPKFQDFFETVLFILLLQVEKNIISTIELVYQPIVNSIESELELSLTLETFIFVYDLTLSKKRNGVLT